MMKEEDYDPEKISEKFKTKNYGILILKNAHFKKHCQDPHYRVLANSHIEKHKREEKFSEMLKTYVDMTHANIVKSIPPENDDNPELHIAVLLR